MPSRLLTCCERYPFFELRPADSEFIGSLVDVPEELIERHDRVMADLASLQEELAALERGGQSQ